MAQRPQLRISGLDGVLGSVVGELVLVYLDAPQQSLGAPAPDVARFFQPPFFEWWDAQETAQVSESATPPSSSSARACLPAAAWAVGTRPVATHRACA